MFTTTCTHCGSPSEVPPHYHARELRCISCHMSFIALPSEERMFEFPCPICRNNIEAAWSWAGISAPCPHCNVTVDIPKPKLSMDALHNKDLPTALNASLPAADTTDGNERSVKPVYTMKGVQDLLEVFTDRVEITPQGVLGFFNKGIKGTKEFPYSSIYAVQFKEAGAVFSGYIQFTIPGGIESRGGLFAAARDENTFMFASPNNNALARCIKQYVDAAIRKAKSQQTALSSTNLADELQKLAGLRDQGILSEQEFQAAKKRLIG